MALKYFARHVAVIAAGCWLGAPLGAHVVDVGTIERPHEHLYNTPAYPSIESPDADAANAESSTNDSDSGIAAPGLTPNLAMPRSTGNPILPWDKRTVYTFADVAPGIDGTLALGGTVRTLYLDVLSIAGAPKTETWLASLIVVCLIAVQLRRTQRLLHHRPIAS